MFIEIFRDGRASPSARSFVGNPLSDSGVDIREPHVDIGAVGSHPFFFTDGRQTRFPGRSARVHGDWRLWIYQCHWSISVENQQLAHSESDRVAIARALGVLNGQALTNDTAVAGHDERRRFAFDLACNLDVWPYADDDPAEAELWMLYEPSGSVVSMCATGELRRSP